MNRSRMRPGSTALLLLVLTLLLSAALIACNTATPTGTGQLTVTLSGLPSGITGDVVITMGRYTNTVHATTTLSSLAPGTYTVTPLPASNGNTIVPTMYDGSASPSTVTVANNNTSAATVSYAVRRGSGQLWVPMNSGSTEAESFASGTLTTTGSANPNVTLTSGAGAAESIAFDHAGNMWVGDDSGYIYRYDAAELASSGSQPPAVTINATAYGGVFGVAFDASGDLWAAAPDSAQLLEYSPAQLASGGALTPAVVLSATGTSLDTPIGIAFDANGDLWVANHNTNSRTVVEFTPAQLAATGSPTPTVVLSTTLVGSVLSLDNPDHIAFDASGNLWVANEVGTVVRFDASQLTTTGSPTPAATLTSSPAWQPHGLAFDASGALWVADYSHQDLLRFTDPSSLSGNVTPTAAVVISGPIGFDYPQLAFNPPPANLPINTP